MRGLGKNYEWDYERKKNHRVLLWVDYERVVQFEIRSWESEVYEKGSWATHVSTRRPEIQSVLTNVRLTKLDTYARPEGGRTMGIKEIFMSGLWEDYENIMRDVLGGRSDGSSWKPKHTGAHTHASSNERKARPYDQIMRRLWEDYERWGAQRLQALLILSGTLKLVRKANRPHGPRPACDSPDSRGVLRLLYCGNRNIWKSKHKRRHTHPRTERPRPLPY